MKLTISLTLCLFALFMAPERSYSLTDYKIKKICEKEKRPLICLKNIKEKRNNMLKGNLIEIPVIPYKK